MEGLGDALGTDDAFEAVPCLLKGLFAPFEALPCVLEGAGAMAGLGTADGPDFTDDFVGAFCEAGVELFGGEPTLGDDGIACFGV